MVVHGGHTWRRPGGLDRIGLGKKIKGSLSLSYSHSLVCVSVCLSLYLGSRGLLRACSARGHGKPKHSRNAETKPAYDRRCYTLSASRITSTKLPARPPKPLTHHVLALLLRVDLLRPLSPISSSASPLRDPPAFKPQRFYLPRRKRGKGLRHREHAVGFVA